MKQSAYSAPGIKTPTEIINMAAASVFNLPVEELYKRSRERKYTEPRMFVFYYRYKKLKHSPNQIAAETNAGFRHSTIIANSKATGRLLEVDKYFRRKYEKFEKLCETA